MALCPRNVRYLDAIRLVKSLEKYAVFNQINSNLFTAHMKRVIPAGLSIYLDAVRILAAGIVILSHVWPLLFPNFPLPWPGHSCVVVFFVLSGFVISHAARPELGLRGYAQHRLARIYPVVLASVCLSAFIALVIPGNDGDFSASRGSDWQDIALNLLFFGQSWTSVSMPYNGPFWSLNYEVWYYLLFGLWCYCPSRLLLCFAALLAGPKILLLMPVWLFGVVLHRNMVPLARRYALWLFMISLCAGLVFFWLDAGVHMRHIVRAYWPNVIELTHGSSQFAGDFVLGVIVSINFLAAGSLAMRFLQRHARVIRYLASFTFSAYLLHMPLTILIFKGAGIHSALPFFSFLVVGIVLLGFLTERRTKWYRSFISQIFREPSPIASNAQIR